MSQQCPCKIYNTAPFLLQMAQKLTGCTISLHQLQTLNVQTYVWAILILPPSWNGVVFPAESLF